VKILYVATDQKVPGATGGSVHVLEVARGLAAPRTRGPRRDRRGRRSRARGGCRIVWHRVAWTPAIAFFRFRARPAVEAIAARGAAGVVMERYYNFGGEGVRTAAARGIPSLLEVNSPVVDHPRSARRPRRRSSCGPCAAIASRSCRQAARLCRPIPEIVPGSRARRPET
jgi:hypothetical protein